VPLPTIDPREFRDEVEERHVRAMVKRSVTDGTLHVGERLPLDDVARWLGAAPGPTRCALEHLARDGCVQFDGKTARVADPRAQ